ncbi:MAG: hypothetical protein QNK37_17820 [Acidobacteriota bacterium]|nr:hypothetical protein [Acidobacteriota bacterium]
MRLVVMFLCLIGSITLRGQERLRVDIEPFDLNQRGEITFFPKSIDQLESGGDHIFIRSNQESNIVMVNTTGRILTKFGGNNMPDPRGVLGMAYHGGRIWGIDSDRSRIREYFPESFGRSWWIKSYQLTPFIPTNNSFALSEDVMVVPVNPSEGYQAARYGLDGQFLGYVGELMDWPRDLEKEVYGIHDTLWFHHEDRWISVFKFFPLVTVYDTRFKVIRQFSVESPVIAAQRQLVEDFVVTPERTLPAPLVTDIKIHDNRLYLMSGGALHQVDLKTGATQAMVFFYGQGEAFAQVPEGRVKFYYFCFTNKDDLILAHPALLWGQDLWKCSSPFSRSQG